MLALKISITALLLLITAAVSTRIFRPTEPDWLRIAALVFLPTILTCAIIAAWTL